jgi:hypothetical protein
MAADEETSKSNVELVSTDNLSASSEPGYLTWNTGPGEIARKLSEKALEEYGAGLKGFIIGPGQCALIYGGGKLLAELSGGTYDFPSRPAEEVIGEREGGVMGALRGAGRAVANFFLGKPKDDKIKEAINRNTESQMEKFIEHMKTGKPFSIFIARKSAFILEMQYQQVQTKDLRTDLGLKASFSVNDYSAFYSDFLIDTEVLTFSSLQEKLKGRFEGTLGEKMLEIEAEKAETDPALKTSLLSALSAKGGCITVHSVEKIFVSHEELEALRQRQEDLILAEKNLVELIKANDFGNRLQLEENRRDLEEAGNKEDFLKRMQAINKDGLLREEDIANFERDIAERAEDQGISRIQALDLVREDNRQEIEEKVRVRKTVTLDHELDLERKRQGFAREEELKDTASDVEEMRLVQQMRKKKEEDELGIETSRTLRDAEIAQNERAQYANMTPEQIVLIRPDLSKEAIEGIVAMNRDTSQSSVSEEAAQREIDRSKETAQSEIDRSKETTEMMKDFMEKQQRTMVDLAGGQAASKEKEIDRIQSSADKTEERLSSVVGSTVDAFKGDAAEATVKGSQPAPPTGEVMFNVAVGKEDQGRHSLSAIGEQIACGKFDPQSKVWRKGMDGWKPAVQVPEIAELMDDAPPPISDDAPPPL